jgi:O-antigen/teichoic acid export membrane protein
MTVGTGFAVFGVTAVQGIILARMLGPHARGEFGTAVFFTYALSSVGLMGAQFAVARRAASDPSGRFGLMRSVTRLGALTGFVTFLVVSVLAFTMLPADKQFLAPLCALSALTQPFEHIRLLLLAVDQGTGAFKRYNIVVLTTSIVLPIALLAAWALGVMSVLTASILVLLPPAVGLAIWLALADLPAENPSKSLLRPITVLREGAPYWISAAVCDLYTRLDQFLILWLASLTAQGQYAAAVPAAGMLLVGADALALFSFNAGSREHEFSSRTRLLQQGALVAGFQAVLAATFALVVGPLIVMFYGDDFAGAIPFAMALIPGQAFHGFARVVEGHLRGRGLVRVGIWARAGAGLLMIAIVMATFDRLSVLAIPLAASIANASLALVLAAYAFAGAGSSQHVSHFRNGDFGA